MTPPRCDICKKREAITEREIPFKNSKGKLTVEVLFLCRRCLKGYRRIYRIA